MSGGWFYVKNGQQLGPVDQPALVEGLLAEAAPDNVQVWREGLGAWTTAAAVPELALELQSARAYFYQWHGTQVGPVEAAALAALLRSGQVPPETHVWRRGLAAWAPAATIPELAAALPAPPAARGARAGAPVDPAFDRDKFLLRQQYLTIHEKYQVWDEQGQPILFVERPGQHLKGLIALAGALGAGAVVGVPLFWAATSFDSGALFAIAIVLVFAAMIAVGAMLSPKRHIQFYRDAERSEKLLEVLQDRKVMIILQEYTLTDGAGRLLARFRKNVFTDIFRKQWVATTPDGRVLCVAKEDSILKALARRFLTNLIRLNFILCRPGSDELYGTFNRTFTLLDRYVLDLTADPRRQLDRRVAIALGVLLDTGERR
jgi:hypothetical protein